MTSSSRRSAALFLVCMTLVLIQGANAANPKFTPLVPKSENAQAQVAARNEAAQKLYQSFYGTKKVDWRKDRSFLKALWGQPDSSKPNPLQADTNSGPMLGEHRLVSSPTSFGSARPSTVVRANGDASAMAGSTFGGFLDMPSYPAIDTQNKFNFVTATATADLNNDGYPDLVSVDEVGNLNVLLNDGKGGFLPPVINTGGQQYITLGQQVYEGDPAPFVCITPGDVNGDGLADLVVTKWGDYYAGGADSPELLVYLNQGNGTFSNPIVVNPILGPNEQLTAIIVTDRDGDHKADIVVVSSTENDQYDANGNLTAYNTDIAVQTLYSNGDGTFKSYGNISHYNYAGYSLLIPNGGAQFVTLQGTKYLAIEAEVYNPNSVGTAVLFFQDSNGGRYFQPVANAPSQEIDFPSNFMYAISFSNGLSLADLNGDGLPDITLTFGDGYLYGALGTSGGGFGSPQMIESGTLEFTPFGWALADVNGDGYPDMIDMESNDVAIWLGKGDGTFADPRGFYSTTSFNYTGAYGSAPGSNLVAADFDRDGNIDFAVNDASYRIRYGRTAIYKGRGDGTFAALPVLAPVDIYMPAAMGLFPWPVDLNGDGIDDIVALDRRYNGLITGINDGQGHFTYKTFGTPPSTNGFQIVQIAGVGDFNGDGRPDLLLSGYLLGDYDNGQTVFSYAVALSKGDGSFTDPIPVPKGTTNFLASGYETALVGDINHDGALDIVVVYRGDHYLGSTAVHTPSGVFVALGNGDGTFQTPSYYNIGSDATNGALADFNGDGYLDLVVYDTPSKKGTHPTVNIYPGNALGSYSAQQAIPLASNINVVKMVPVDLNNDGKIDIAIAISGIGLDPSTAGVQIYMNNGDGTFTLTNTLEQGYGALDADMVTADFNGDGCADLFTSADLASATATDTFYGGHLSLGNCDGTFQAPQSMLLPPASVGLEVAKFTADGVPSITGANDAYASNFVLYNQAGAKVSVTASDSKITQGNSVSFNAAVDATWAYRPIPGGTVSFYDNGTLLGTQSVNAGGASFSTSNLTVGSHLITVSYSGDENFNPHKDAAYTSVAVSAAPAPTQAEIAISSPVSNLTLHPGDSQTVTLTLAGSANYTGTVKFTVSGATGGLGVTVNPATVSLTNGAATSVSVIVTTKPTTTAAMAHPLPRWLGMTFGATAFGAFFLGIGSRRRKSLWICLLMVFCVMGLCLVSTGCGGNSNHYAKPGASTIVVTATPSVPGASVQTTTFNVTVD